MVTRLAGRLADAGGFGDATVELPEGRWSDVVSVADVRRWTATRARGLVGADRSAGRAARAGTGRA